MGCTSDGIQGAAVTIRKSSRQVAFRSLNKVCDGRLQSLENFRKLICLTEPNK